MTLEEELNTVYCHVHYRPTVSRLLTNDAICEKLTKEAVSRIRSYGINCIEEMVAPRGGDYGSLWSYVAYLWENRRFSGLILAVFRALLWSIKHPFSHRLANSKPTLVIFLKIRKRSEKEDWHGPINEKLVDLKHLAQDLSNWLGLKYPIYSFDQQFGVSLSPESYRVNVYQSRNKTSSYNNGRLICRLRALKPQNNVDIRIDFSKFLFLRQTVNPTTCDGQMWRGENKYKTYFTVISSRLITRYPRVNSSQLHVSKVQTSGLSE